MPKLVQGLIFDLDGTLIDSRADIVDAVNHSLQALHLGLLDAQQISQYVGDGVRNLISRSLAHFDRQDLLAEGIACFKKVYGEHLLDNTRLYPGVAEILESFKAKPMAVITNKPEDFSLHILEGLKIRSYFNCILGGDSLAAKKPDPGPLLRVLARWGLDPSQVVVVGDSSNDIEAGKKAGTWTCAVTYGFKTHEELQALAPDWLIANISEIRDYVC